MASSVLLRRPFLIAFMCLLTSSMEARAQWTKGSSLYTQDGVEIAVDARVFSTFALLNSVGYQAETRFGPPPLRMPQFAAVRAATRERMGRPGASTRAFSEVVARHSVEPQAYIAAALELGPAPRFEAEPKASTLAKELSPVLQSWFNEDGGAVIYRQGATDLAEEQRKVLASLDSLTQAATAAVKLGSEEDALLEDDSGPTGRVAVLLNPLDAHGALSRHIVGEMTYIVTGPLVDETLLPSVVRAAGLAYGITLVARDVDGHGDAPAVGQLYAELEEAVRARFASKAAFAREFVACALLRSLSPGECAGSPLDDSAALRGRWPELSKRLGKVTANAGELFAAG
ncbi:MAG: hypothetical protein ACO32I_09290, partial [Candidatus Limnocylindrus sp.]